MGIHSLEKMGFYLRRLVGALAEFRGALTSSFPLKKQMKVEYNKPTCYQLYLPLCHKLIKNHVTYYRDEERTKHFLIDASVERCYFLFGSDQIRHDSLKEMLEYHKVIS